MRLQELPVKSRFGFLSKLLLSKSKNLLSQLLHILLPLTQLLLLLSIVATFVTILFFIDERGNHLLLSLDASHLLDEVDLLFLLISLFSFHLFLIIISLLCHFAELC